MEVLHIKCPACGAVLEVKNSKNEAVKRIICPQCKKHLAVTFREEPKPAQFVEIKMVQLSDGSTKTIVRALTAEHIVKVNGEQLQKDDEVVLAIGDELQIDDTKGVFGKEGYVNYQQVTPPPTTPPTKVPSDLTPAQPPSHRHWMLYAALIAALAVALVGWKWFTRPQMPPTPPVAEVDTLSTPQPKTEKKEAGKPRDNKKSTPKANPKPERKQPHLTSLSNYDLEKLALGGDVDAQYQLGKRWVNKHDSINVVKGIKYLKMAAQNGSSEASNALRTVFSALQQSAANGSSTAGNILREQR